VAKTKKKTDKYRGMGPDELTKEERALRDQVWKLRQQMATGQLDRPHKVEEARRDLARLLTIRRELETAAKAK